MKILHQAGHCTNWNIESLNEDGVGDGIIFSPLHKDYKYIMENTTDSLKQKSLFDPQFYIPNSQKNKLNSYDFFPEQAMSGFESGEFSTFAGKVAEKCIAFQLSNNFNSIIIPARYSENMYTDYIAKQKILFVEPFLNYLEKVNSNKEIYLTLPLIAPMVEDKKYRKDLLNWISSYPDVDGVYLMINFDEDRKQINNFDKLYNYCSFIKELKYADLKIICGYSNLEGLLFTLLDIDTVTIGAYENTRKFSIDKFIESDTGMRGPVSRLYFPKLLNWLRYDLIKEIKEDHPLLWDEIYTQTKYADEMFKKKPKPHFTQPDSYKHYFLTIWDQYQEILKLNKEEKNNYFSEKINEANSYYKKMKDAGIIFVDPNCFGEHLESWNRLINKLQQEI